MNPVYPYNEKVPLKADLEKVECWNCTDGSTGTIPAGTVIEVCCANDREHTTIQVESGPALRSAGRVRGLPLNHHDDGKMPQQELGYRFIVKNSTLREATGLPIEDTMRDLVGDMILAEEGQMDDEQLASLIVDMKKAGMWHGLQGWWGRQAVRLGIEP